MMEDDDSGGEKQTEESEQWMTTLEYNDPSLNQASGVDPKLQKQETSESHVSRMELNTNKAGMEGLDKERINKIIMDMSVGSRYYENEQKKEKQVNQKIEKLLNLRSKVTASELSAAKVKVNELVKGLERNRDLSRTIVHIDMDMFYAAVEMLEKPELRTKPMAVGGKAMLSTSNYVARRYGVRAGMPGFIGLKLCPDLVLVPTNFAKYREYSSQVKEILAEYDPNFSAMSLDEAFLDFTDHLVWRRATTDKERTFMRHVHLTPSDADRENHQLEKDKDSEIDSEREEKCQNRYETEGELLSIKQSKEGAQLGSTLSGPEELSEGPEDKEGVQSPQNGELVVFGTSVEEAVNEMRFRIHQRTKLTASAGIAPNCMLAKIASDMNKPNGQFMIQPTKEEVLDFISKLPVRKISGIGKVMERVLSALGVNTCSDLYENRALLYKIFSSISFNHFIKISLGLGSTDVGRGDERKSMSTERTFRDKSKPEDLLRICQDLCDSLAKEVEKKGLKGKHITMKVKTVDFEVKNRSQSLMSGISTSQEIFAVARELLQTEIRACQPRPLSLRLMGVRLSAFLSEEEVQGDQRQKSLMSFMKKSSPSKRKLRQESIPAVPSETAKEEEEESPTVDAQEDEIIVDEDSRESVDQETRGTDLMESIASAGSHKYTCPVCSRENVYKNLEEFNRHVDICLNKGAISSLLKTQAASQEPTTSSAESLTPLKRASNSSSSTRKKLKTKGSGKFPTLDKFFTKHS